MALLSSGSLYRRYAEIRHPGMRLGRSLWLDGRSSGFMVENSAAMSRRLVSKQWDRRVPILNQGDLGSCTANAGIGTLGTEPFYSSRGREALGASMDGAVLEQAAVELYSEATRVDPYPGTYPPEDTGSSGLAICKVLLGRGAIAGYTWASTAAGFAALLQTGPVLVGMPWYEAFFHPGANGLIDMGSWRSSGLAGGHEIEAVGIEVNTRDLNRSVVTFANSWGPGWGEQGFFRMHLALYDQLSGVDLKQFTL